MGLQEKFFKILMEYNNAYAEVWTKGKFTHTLLDYFNNDVKKEVSKIVESKNNKLHIKSGTGSGRTTKTPFIAILDNRITSKVSEGTYIVYLFNKDKKTLYLSLEQGIKGVKECAKELGLNGRELTNKSNQILEDEKRRVLNLISVGDFVTDNKISTGKKDYDISAIAYKKYDIDSLPNDEALKQDLYKMIDIYEEYYEKCTVKNDEEQKNNILEDDSEESIHEEGGRVVIEDIEAAITDIHKYIKNQGMVIELKTIKNLYISLKSKPFVILAGISGTGKSKIARLFTEAIGGEYKLIPVRPDWSDSSDLLGHVNLDNRFIPGSVTEFLAEANRPENLNKPYILCLDEMNLARVEYYFSDFLSILETRYINSQGRIVSDNIFTQTDFGSDVESLRKYESIYISENVYFIGTVNMDETTFPFSKKVLDRANTIEFSDVNLSIVIEDTRENELIKAINVDNLFLKSEYLSFRGCYAQSPEEIKQMIVILERINEALKLIGGQVAYRVRDEVSYYISYATKYKLLSFKEAMDYVFMQKILPRIQGSSLALQSVFRELCKVLVDTEEFEDNELLDQLEKYIQSNKDNSGILNADYPKCVQKIVFMLRRFIEDGYTSYWI